MCKKKLFLRFTLLIVFIFLLNSLAGEFHWYSSIWYFDMPMHFLGGFWLGLFFLWFFYPNNLSFKLIFKIILCVLLIGILWELFELFFVNYVGQLSFNTLDTTSDLSFDLVGGFSSILYFFKRI